MIDDETVYKRHAQELGLATNGITGALWMIFFFYIPVFGNVVAFKDFRFSSDGGFLRSLYESEWVGLKNFEFLFSSDNAWIITRNTVLYNPGFIVIGTTCASLPLL
ncbi:hypothetical protein MGH68_01535 [Erysipelothrix sp. D19-032]